MEQLQNEINALDSRIKKVRKQIDLPSTEKEIKMQMGEFLQVDRKNPAAVHVLSELQCHDDAHFLSFTFFKNASCHIISISVVGM